MNYKGNVIIRLTYHGSKLLMTNDGHHKFYIIAKIRLANEATEAKKAYEIPRSTLRYWPMIITLAPIQKQPYKGIHISSKKPLKVE